MTPSSGEDGSQRDSVAAGSPADDTEMPGESPHFDVVVVGAGIGGIYATYKFREQGLSVRCIEGAGGVGGVWYHNRYPGARVDVDSFDYCYYFSEDLYRDWEWSERYAAQPELLAYLNHVTDRFDLRQHMRFDTWVTGAEWNSDQHRYVITTSRGDRCTAQFLVMATGMLSAARTPDFSGLEDFEGEWVQTSHWPDHPVDWAGKRVAVIGTGSSGVQTVPVVAEDARHVHVFQRTPNYSVPARNGPMDAATWREIASDLDKARQDLYGHAGATHIVYGDEPASRFTADERIEVLEQFWRDGGHGFGRVFSDQGLDADVNDLVADFVRDKIRSTVDDPETAERLCPWDHPIGTRRLVLDIGYYESFNRDNVTLVDARDEAIEHLTATGIQTSGRHYEVDLIIFALGFHAFTGAIDRAGIRNDQGASPTDHWDRGPRTFLGVMTAGFPNFFMLTGPGSPSVLANMTIGNEFHVDWVAQVIEHLRTEGKSMVEPTAEGEAAWVAEVAAVSDRLLRRRVRNYMVHINDDDDDEFVFIPYAGGFNRYVERVESIGYDGLSFR
ncbi:MAG: NAD(P)/FAD-dependent oxidoreductase [Ilumatobacteraceae bacterium]|nr:NAD(P)/FAD-dependent oxidoreductase [Ilumatobacteraceae bacterium]